MSALERTREYPGLYHVLHGALSPLDGIGPEELRRFWEHLPQRYPALRHWIVWLQAQVTPVLSGGLAELADNPRVVESYLGFGAKT